MKKNLEILIQNKIDIDIIQNHYAIKKVIGKLKESHIINDYTVINDYQNIVIAEYSNLKADLFINFKETSDIEVQYLQIFLIKRFVFGKYLRAQFQKLFINVFENYLKFNTLKFQFELQTTKFIEENAYSNQKQISKNLILINEKQLSFDKLNSLISSISMSLIKLNLTNEFSIKYIAKLVSYSQQQQIKQNLIISNLSFQISKLKIFQKIKEYFNFKIIIKPQLTKIIQIISDRILNLSVSTSDVIVFYDLLINKILGFTDDTEFIKQKIANHTRTHITKRKDFFNYILNQFENQQNTIQNFDSDIDEVEAFSQVPSSHIYFNSSSLDMDQKKNHFQGMDDRLKKVIFNLDSSQSVTGINSNSLISFDNEFFEKLYGYAIDEILSCSVQDYSHILKVRNVFNALQCQQLSRNPQVQKLANLLAEFIKNTEDSSFSFKIDNINVSLRLQNPTQFISSDMEAKIEKFKNSSSKFTLHSLQNIEQQLESKIMSLKNNYIQTYEYQSMFVILEVNLGNKNVNLKCNYFTFLCLDYIQKQISLLLEDQILEHDFIINLKIDKIKYQFENKGIESENIQKSIQRLIQAKIFIMHEDSIDLNI